MILIQVREWPEPSRTATHKPGRFEVKEKIVAFASRLELEEALFAVEEYENEYQVNYPEDAVRYAVLGFQVIPDLSDDALEAARLKVVEEAAKQLREERVKAFQHLGAKSDTDGAE